jgi:hypothetical protein
MLCKRPLTWQRWGAAALVLGTVLATAAPASAHVGDGGDPNLVHACVVNVLLLTRIVGPDGSCITEKETAVHWSIRGPQGPPGPQGPAGTLGSFDQLAGLACTAPGGQAGSVEVTHRNGVATLRCLVEGVRFIDNGDGTITDLQTGLMWEKKVAGATCLNCVDDRYSWDAAMIDWLDRLNGRLINSPNEGGVAGHSDWRLPTLAELQTIVELNASGCAEGSPCIDPIFGPSTSSLSSLYWSASTPADFPEDAWFVDFSDGDVNADRKNGTYHVRAVRGGW